MGSKQTKILEIGGSQLARRTVSRLRPRRQLMKRAKKGMGKKRITARQKAARRKNIAIARKYRKRGGGKLSRKSRLVKAGGSAVSSAAKYRGYDKRTAVKTKRAKKIYKKEFKASYTSKQNKGKSRAKRVQLAHKNALKWSTGTRTWGAMGGGYRDRWRIPGSTYKPRRRRK